jgi:hypothetical protein
VGTIKRLQYFWGTGIRADSKRPRDAKIAVSVGGELVTKQLLRSFQKERIADLKGVFGDPSAGDPPEVDYLLVEIGSEAIETIVYNRGIALFAGNDEKILRLYRFFSTIETELRG